jgi:hypothetical protein
MQQHEVEVAVGAELPTAERAHGHETHSRFVTEKLDQPRVDEAGVGPAEGAASK